MPNETIQYTNSAINYVTYLSKTLTEKITEFLTNQGFNVTSRWTSLLVLFISLAFFYLGMKISKPFVKWILIILSIILIGGLIIPW
jgi:small neutral amino acid transporter SnatA (MarC family)